MNAWLKNPEFFRAPCCGDSLRLEGSALICMRCGYAYLIQNEIAILLPPSQFHPSSDLKKREPSTEGRPS